LQCQRGVYIRTSVGRVKETSREQIAPFVTSMTETMEHRSESRLRDTGHTLHAHQRIQSIYTDMAARTFSSAFKQHLSYFSHGGNGIITAPSALYGALGLGLNLPFSVVLSVALPLLYGNTGPFKTQVDVESVQIERPQLQALGDPSQRAYTRAEVLETVKQDSWVNWMHVLNLWSLAADGKGLMSAEDVRSCQKGTLMVDVAKRRKSRENRLLFSRGGPFS